MQLVSGRRLEFGNGQIEGTSTVVFGMYEEGSNTDFLRKCRDFCQGMDHQGPPKSVTLRGHINGKTGEQNDWYRVSWKPLSYPSRGGHVIHAARRQGVVAHDPILVAANEDRSHAGLLAREGVLLKPGR